MSWSPFPFLRIAFAMVLGILFFEKNEVPSNIILSTIIIAFAAYFSIDLIVKNFNQSFFKGVLLLTIFFLIGGLCIKTKADELQNSVLPDKEVILYGSISEELKSGLRKKFLIKTKWKQNSDKSIQKHNSNLIIVFDEKDTLAGKYKAGDFLWFKSNLKKVKKNTNPQAFDYAFYLKSKDILQQGFVKAYAHVPDSNKVDNPLSHFARKSSSFASATLRKYISDLQILGIAEAILLGQKLLLSEDIYQDYSDTGAIHVLSVSGLHVAIFISLFVWLFSKIKRDDITWKISKITILLLIVWFYVILTGLSPSVIRAGIMVSLYIIGTNLFKGTNSFNILAVSAIAMLMYNPYYLFQISFQFSYISLLSILYFQPKIKSWWVPKSGVAIFIWDLINVSLAAQIMIFPFTIYYFHQFPVYFALSGIIAIPLVTFIIYCGTVVIIFEVIYNSFNTILAVVFETSIKWLNYFIGQISNLPFSKIENIWVSDVGLLLMVIAIILLILWIEMRQIKIFYMMLTFCFFTILENRMNELKASKYQNLFIYDTYGGVIIDILQNKSLHCIKSKEISEKTLAFTTKNNRIKHKIDMINCQSDTLENVNSLQYFGQDLIYISHANENIQKIKANTEVKVLYITHFNKNSPDKICSRVIPEIVVLDRNIKPWIAEKWVNLQNKMNFTIHNIKEDGAFVLSDFQPK